METFELTRYLFQKALACQYLIAFLIAVRQLVPLIGARGLLPIQVLLKKTNCRNAPSLFWLNHSDNALKAASWAGVALALFAFSGISEQHGFLLSFVVWATLWALYLSIVNVGQTFYGFGWESLLLETGFLAIFFGPADVEAPVIVVWLLRWVLFRVMFGAGLIKLRGDPCWRNLTCLMYHYETQPMPNPLSWYFHHFPVWMHKIGVLFNHFVELIVPIFYFAPAPLCAIAGLLTILFQLTLIASGNLSWLNYITIIIAIPCFNDAYIQSLLPLTSPHVHPAPWPYQTLLYVLAAAIALLSIRPAMNLFSRRQAMNRSYDMLHLVNTYGAFGGITKERMEIIIEGTDAVIPSESAIWKPYEFIGKPGRIDKRPPIISPYHLRLDWQIWFAAMSSYHYHPWLLNVVAKLLQNDKQTLGLLEENPFPENPPKYIRANLYHYQFTDKNDPSPNWWKRTFEAEYLPPLSLNDVAFHAFIKRQGWL